MEVQPCPTRLEQTDPYSVGVRELGEHHTAQCSSGGIGDPERLGGKQRQGLRGHVPRPSSSTRRCVPCHVLRHSEDSRCLLHAWHGVGLDCRAVMGDHRALRGRPRAGCPPDTGRQKPHLVTGKSSCKGAKARAAPRGEEAQNLGRQDRRELGSWILTGQVGLVGLGLPTGLGVHWEPGQREAGVTVATRPPQPW